MEFDEKELRKEISYAIKNIHGVRQVETAIYHKLHVCLGFICVSCLFMCMLHLTHMLLWHLF